MANIRTINNVIEVFKDISTRHYQLNSFGNGLKEDIGASKELLYPILWIDIDSAELILSDNGFSEFELDVNVRVGDLVNKDKSNEDDVLSDSLEILKDIMIEFNQHPYYNESKFNLSDSVTFEKFTEDTDEVISGWETDITLRMVNNNRYCGLPISGITSSTGFPNI